MQDTFFFLLMNMNSSTSTLVRPHTNMCGPWGSRLYKTPPILVAGFEKGLAALTFALKKLTSGWTMKRKDKDEDVERDLILINVGTMLATIWCIPQANNFIRNASLANYCTLVPTSQHSHLIPATSQSLHPSFFSLFFQSIGDNMQSPGTCFFCLRGKWWNTWFGRQNPG